MNVPLRVIDRPARISCAASAAPGGPVSPPHETRHERSIPTAIRRPAGRRPKISRGTRQSAAADRIRADQRPRPENRRRRTRHAAPAAPANSPGVPEREGLLPRLITNSAARKRVPLGRRRLPKFQIERESDNAWSAASTRATSRTSTRTQGRVCRHRLHQNAFLPAGTCSRPPPTPPSRSCG